MNGHKQQGVVKIYVLTGRGEPGGTKAGKGQFAMAAGYSTYNNRRSDRRGRNQRRLYVYGNTVRQAETVPVRAPKARPAETEKKDKPSGCEKQKQGHEYQPGLRCISYCSGCVRSSGLCSVSESAVRRL